MRFLHAPGLSTTAHGRRGPRTGAGAGPADTPIRGKLQAAPASGQATAGQCLSGAGYCAYAFAGTPNFSGGPANGYYEFGTLAVQIPFIFGAEFYVGYTLKAKATAQAISWDQFALAGAATGAANFAHTLAWGDIDGVFLAGGTPVGDFTLVSGSGFDYRTSAASVVPVPAAGWLLGSGALWLVALARRRARPERAVP